MFFDDLSLVREISKKVGCAVFVVPRGEVVEIKNAIVLEPVEKSVITIDQVREILLKINVRQVKDQFIMIRPAEALSEEAANGLLKSLEEPNEKVHFVLITDEPTRLLPTIRSRSMIYYYRKKSDDISATPAVKELAKKLMAAKPAELLLVAEEISKKKDGVRAFALEVTGTAIAMLYKTYFITEKQVFLKKLPKFLELYDRIERNGHIKLSIVAALC